MKALRLKSGNTEEIEQAVQDEAVQLGIVDGTARRTDLHYLPFMEDEDVYKRQAYHIYSSADNSTTHIAELTPDYTEHTGKFVRVFPRCV